MALISPGLEVTVTDDSNYLPTAVGSVPYILLATAEDKAAGASSSIASGTLKANAGLVNVVSSQRELVSLFGYPKFRTNSAGTPLHGDELNEYGLMAAYSALGIGNRVYIQRADINLDQLSATTVRPTATPADGTVWLDLNNTRFGAHTWDQTSNAQVAETPTIVSTSADLSGIAPAGSVDGRYAVVTTNTNNQMFYRAGSVVGPLATAKAWVEVGSSGWQYSVPTLVSSTAVGSITGQANLIINGSNITLGSSPTLSAVVSAINAKGILGVGATHDATNNLLVLFANSSSKSGNVVSDGKITISANTAALLSNLAITSGTYYSPQVSFAQFPPDWRSSNVPTSSVWIKTAPASVTEAANFAISHFDDTAGTWKTSTVNMPDGTQIAAPLYATEEEAIFAMDPTAGGVGIVPSTVYVKYNALQNNTVTFKPYIKTVSGVLKVIGGTTTPNVTPNSTITITASVPGQSTTQTVVVTFGPTTDTAAEAVSDILTACQAFTKVGDVITVPAMSYIVAKVETTGAISISHLAGGFFTLKGSTSLILSDLGFTSATAHMRVDPVDSTKLVASPFDVLTYSYSYTVPFTDPVDGTMWYAGAALEADIMIHSGSGWKGYRNVDPDARGYILSQTDPAGPLFSTIAPTTQSDGTVLVAGDLWIDTSDLENYPVIYRYNSLGKWILIDNTNQTTENGIVFADARWDTAGTANPITDTLPTIAAMGTSDYLDLDAPDYRLYARGTLLFNTRRSSMNVKRFVSDHFNATSFPNSSLPTMKNTWISASGLQQNGYPYMGRKAVRAVVVAAMKSAVDSSTAIREEQLDFNLLTAPGYTELIQNLSALNTDRKNTGFIIGDTPMHLAADSTTLSQWSATVESMDSEDGIATIDYTVGVFYPSGITNDLQGRQIAVPPSHMMLRTMLHNDEIAYPWFAPAGVRRGTIDNVRSIGYVEVGTNRFVNVGINEAQRDILYANRVNPITVLPSVGLNNFGNKTRAGANTALDRINVSRLVCYIRRQLAQVANNYLFEPNDAITRNSIKSLVETLLNDLIAKRGVTDYLVVCDDSNNTPDRIARNELYVDVAIEPTKAVEFIYVPIRIKNPGEIKGGNAASSLAV